ncbi:hypothetical protein NDU88_001858 [Pleurodeles waltl]|uniref:Uncharacterized protein n=1 Tax=Pleurodeles waltl TaxID=8319 RepID=A0AAV7UVW2_PLEWA|nr:hypothetical protein NDU88_001858 [Pleurodeles waltl]
MTQKLRLAAWRQLLPPSHFITVLVFYELPMGLAFLELSLPPRVKSSPFAPEVLSGSGCCTPLLGRVQSRRASQRNYMLKIY